SLQPDCNEALTFGYEIPVVARAKFVGYRTLSKEFKLEGEFASLGQVTGITAPRVTGQIFEYDGGAPCAASGRSGITQKGTCLFKSRNRQCRYTAGVRHDRIP